MMNFKKILLVTLSLLSLSAFAELPYREPEKVCLRISDTDSNRCLSKVHRSTYFDKRALYVCDRYKGNSVTADCVTTIANKVYRNEDLVNCDAYVNAITTNQCLNQFGIGIDHLSKSELQHLHTRPYAWFQRGSVID